MRKWALFAIFALIVLAFGVCFAEEEHVHDWGNFVVLTEPTCTSEGQEVRTCKICGAVDVVTLAMTDHTFGAWTYYSDEYHERVCSVCGERERTSHDAAVSKNISSATDTRLGKKNITCAGCGYNYTRYVSTYGRLYSTEGIDVLGNGTSYMKVNTITMKAGSERQLTLYSDAVFDIYAVNDISFEIYANASNGEFRGIKLTEGSADLTVSGANASLDFIDTVSGAKLNLKFKDGANALSLLSGEKDLKYVYLSDYLGNDTRVSIYLSALKGGTLSASLSSYSASQLNISCDKDGFTVDDALPLLNLSFNYSASNRAISSSVGSGALSFKSGNNVLLNGAPDGSFGKDEIAFGWYPVYVSADETFTFNGATYSESGELVSIPQNGSAPVKPNDNASEDDNKTAEPLDYITASSELNLTSGTAPKIEISYSAGTYSVKVSSIPSGYSVSRIQLVQKFNYGGMELQNAYSAEASFTVKNAAGSIKASVILQDSKGNEITIDAGAYEYREE